MSDALAQAYVDIVPNMDRFGPALSSGIQGAAEGSAGAAATKAGETLASRIGDGLHSLGGQIGGEVGNLVSRVGDGLDRISSSGSNFGLKMIAAGGAALGLGTALRSLGSADSAAQQQLQAAITATGQSWGDYQTRIEEAIKSGENFAQSAVSTQNALQALTTATGDPAKALQFLGVAFNLAAARHIDLVSAATLVGRALEGNTRLLKQYGIDTTGVATSSTAAAAAVGKLGDKFAGQAAASVNTFNGRLDVLKTKAVDIAATFAGPVGAGLQGFGAATALAGGILQSRLVVNMRTAVGEAEGFRGKLSALSGSGVGSLGKFAVGVTVAVGALELLNKAFGSAPDQGRGINQLMLTLRQLPTVGSNLNDVAASGQTFAETIATLTNPGAVDRLNSFTEGLAGIFGIHGGPTEQSTQAVQQLDQALTQLVNNGQAGVAAVDLQRMDGVLKAAGVDVDAFHKLLPGYTDAVAGLSPAEKAAAQGAVDMGKAADDAKKAYDALTTAVTTFNSANIDAQQADIATRDSLAKVNEALKASHGSLKLSTQLGRDARSATLDFASSVDRQAQALIAEGAPHKKIVDLYNAQDLALQDLLVKMGLSRAEAKRYADGLLKIPKSVQTKIDAEYRATISVLLQERYATGIHSGSGPVGPFTPSHPFIPIHPARGGLIVGGGTDTSDSIPAMVSNHEFMVNAAAVRRVGVETLHRINSGQDIGGSGTHLHYHEAAGRTGQRSSDDVWRALVAADALLALAR
jgi:hypothetical protein